MGRCVNCPVLVQQFMIPTGGITGPPGRGIGQRVGDKRFWTEVCKFQRVRIRVIFQGWSIVGRGGVGGFNGAICDWWGCRGGDRHKPHSIGTRSQYSGPPQGGVEADAGEKSGYSNHGLMEEEGYKGILPVWDILKGLSFGDALNLFNNLSRLAMLWIIFHWWYSGACLDFNLFISDIIDCKIFNIQ